METLVQTAPPRAPKLPLRPFYRYRVPKGSKERGAPAVLPETAAIPAPAPVIVYDSIKPERQIEIINGIPYVMPSPRILHQHIIRKLIKKFESYLDINPVGEIFISPIDVVLSETPKRNWVQPDLIYISNAREEIIKSANIQGAPDIAVEVVSSDLKREVVERKRIFAKFGVAEVWLVVPALRLFSIYVLDENKKYILFSAAVESGSVFSRALEGLQIDVEKLYQNVERFEFDEDDDLFADENILAERKAEQENIL